MSIFMSLHGHETRNFCNMFKSFFSTVFLAAFLFFFLLTASILSNLSLHSIVFRSSRPNWVLPAYSARLKFIRNYSPLALRSVEEVHEDFSREPSPLLAPINVTAEERMRWFKRNLNKFEIIQSTALSRTFAARAQDFFDARCEARFFMTWISPVRWFGQREFLVLESLFKAHPFGCLMILSASMDSRRGIRVLKPLTDSGFKVAAVTPNVPFLLENTPAEPWFKTLKKGDFDPGEISLAQNLSNLLRLAVLYKYGGIYLDADVVVMKKLTSLRNSIGAQTIDRETGKWSRLNNAVLIFDKNHPLLFKFIQEYAHTFSGNKWGHNGPYLVSRVVARVANRPGYNFTILPPLAFYAVDWRKIGGLFWQPKDPATSKWVEAKLLQLRENSYAFHLWNRQSCNLRIEEGSVISSLFSDVCLFCGISYSA